MTCSTRRAKHSDSSISSRARRGLLKNPCFSLSKRTSIASFPASAQRVKEIPALTARDESIGFSMQNEERRRITSHVVNGICECDFPRRADDRNAEQSRLEGVGICGGQNATDRNALRIRSERWYRRPIHIDARKAGRAVSVHDGLYCRRMAKMLGRKKVVRLRQSSAGSKVSAGRRSP